MRRAQDHHPEALLFLNEVTRKIKTYLNDKRIARERARREGTAATSRRWFAPAEMWVQGAVAAESAAPEQPANEEKDQVRPNHTRVGAPCASAAVAGGMAAAAGCVAMGLERIASTVLRFFSARAHTNDSV